MTVLLAALGLILAVPAFATRLIDLAPTRLGALNYYSLVFSETFVKRLNWRQGILELAALAVGLVIVGATIGPAAAMAVLAALLLLEIRVRHTERTMLTSGHLRTDSIKMGSVGQQYPSPSTHPELTLNLCGPLVARVPSYDLGTIAVGRPLELRLLIGNHSIVPTQRESEVSVQSTGGLNVTSAKASTVPVLHPGQVHEVAIGLEARGPASGGKVGIEMRWGDRSETVTVQYGRCVPADDLRPANVAITRYPGGTKSAFAWRGDMDVYDTSTFQSIAGLETTLGLAARYRFPQSLYLSTRLTVSIDEANEFWDRWGLDRGQAEIPAFIEWMRDNVDMQHELGYPFESDKPYALELGNHGHLHFGTDMAADAANDWTPAARMGAGRYPWLGEATDSESEQRDNGAEANRLSEELFDFSLRSWSMPDRTIDEHTAAALWAAGCEVMSDSDITAGDNVMRQPPPHHPNGTDAVELTKRYPGDPDTVHKVSMIKYWIHRGHRLGIPVIFMCHQHMKQWTGHACTRFTEHILRHVLSAFNGDLHINTLYGVGTYWNETMSPKNRSVDARIDGDEVVIENAGDRHLRDVPVDVDLESGGSMTYLIELPPHTVQRIKLTDG